MKNVLTRKSLAYGLYLLLGLAILIFAYARIRKETIGGDIHVFWQVGYSYIRGLDLYLVLPGMREFIYPPFAAVFFIPLGIFPFKIGAYLFFVGNFALWYFCFRYILKIADHFQIALDKRKWIVLGTFLLTFKLYWNNVMMIQSNAYIFLFSLMGIYFFLKNRNHWAIFFIGMATSIKLTPVVLFFWMVARRRSLSFFFKCCLAGALFIFVPWILRGWSQGLHDFQTFYHLIIDNFLHGNVNVSYANQNIGGVLHRYLTDLTGREDGRTYQLVTLDPSFVKSLSSYISLIILSLPILSTLWQMKKKIAITPYEISTYLIVAHLISGSTWKAHLVTLAFPLFFLLAGIIEKRWKNKSLRFFSYFCAAFFALLALTGKELIGREGIVFVGAYGFFTIGMLLLLGGMIFFSLRASSES